MGVLRAFRITGFVLSLGAFLAVGHQYYTAMNAPSGTSARFVSTKGEVSRPGQGVPTFMDSTKAFFAGLTGKEQKPDSGLSALHTRTKMSQMSYDEYTMREITFWTDFMSKLGFAGP